MFTDHFIDYEKWDSVEFFKNLTHSFNLLKVEYVFRNLGVGQQMKAQGPGKRLLLLNLLRYLGNEDDFYSTSFQEEFVSTNRTESTQNSAAQRKITGEPTASRS